MTYGTAITLPRRPAPVMALLEDRDTGWRGSEAEYAEKMRELMVKEARRPGVPQSATQVKTPMATLGDRVLALLAKHGPMTRGALGKHAHRSGTIAYAGVDWLVERGLVEMIAPPSKGRGAAMLVALTDAGRAKAEAGR